MHRAVPHALVFTHALAPLLPSRLPAQIVLASMGGSHGSVCAYGQTSTGKTFTMQGTNKHPGIIPQAVHECFEFIGQVAFPFAALNALTISADKWPVGHLRRLRPASSCCGSPTSKSTTRASKTF